MKTNPRDLLKFIKTKTCDLLKFIKTNTCDLLKFIKTNPRDLLIGIASIVFSLCAGIWTLFNYNVNEKNTELEAIFSITEKIELVKLKDLEFRKLRARGTKIEEEEIKEKEMDPLLFELQIEIRYRFTQIKKPLFTDYDLWKKDWTNLYGSTGDLRSSKVLSRSYISNLRNIDTFWDKILDGKDLDKILVK